MRGILFSWVSDGDIALRIQLEKEKKSTFKHFLSYSVIHVDVVADAVAVTTTILNFVVVVVIISAHLSRLHSLQPLAKIYWMQANNAQIHISHLMQSPMEFVRFFLFSIHIKLEARSLSRWILHSLIWIEFKECRFVFFSFFFKFNFNSRHEADLKLYACNLSSLNAKKE